jgi:hypothetical protein
VHAFHRGRGGGGALGEAALAQAQTQGGEAGRAARAAAASRTFRIKPCLVIQAHQGACNGLQLVEADAGLRAQGPGGAPPNGYQTPVDLGSAAPTVAPSRARSPRSSGHSSAVNSARRRALAAEQQGVSLLHQGRSATLALSAARGAAVAGGGDGDEQGDGPITTITTIVTPPPGSASASASASAAAAAAAAAASAAANANGASETKGPSNRELQLAEEARLRQWATAEFDDDSDEHEGEEEHGGVDPAGMVSPSAASAAPSVFGGSRSGSKRASLAPPQLGSPGQSVRDLPDNPRGVGRRTSFQVEMRAERSRAGSRAGSRATSPSAARGEAAAEPPSAESLAAAAAAKDAAASQAQKASGQALLTYGSDGCVHLFSVATHKKLGTLQQGFTVRNCNTTPPEWRYYYPIRARQQRDEMELSATIARVEESEAAVRERQAAGLLDQLLPDRTAEELAAGIPRLRSNNRPVLQIKKLRTSSVGSMGSIGEEKDHSHSRGTSASGSAAASRSASRNASRRTSGMPASPNPRDLSRPGSLMPPSATAAMEGQEQQQQGQEGQADGDGSAEPAAESLEAAEHERMDADFMALEQDVRRAVRQQRKQLRSAQSKRSLPSSASASAAAAGDSEARAALRAQQLQQAKIRSIVASKSLSALTPSIYASVSAASAASATLSSSASAVSVLSVPGMLTVPASVPPQCRALSPSKSFTSVDYSSTWVDFDGTVRTLDDPLNYRFDVDGYLAHVATRKEAAAAAASSVSINRPQSDKGSGGGGGSRIGSGSGARILTVDTTPLSASASPSPSPYPFTPNSAGRDRDSGSEAGSSRRTARPSHSPSGTDVRGHTPQSAKRPSISGGGGSGPSASLSSGTVSGALPDDDSMARLQGATLARQRRLQLEESRRAAKAKARSLELLELSLAREAELRATLQREDRKLSPRSADAIRVRMLMSRKPVKMVHAQLGQVGMRLDQTPQPRRRLDAFGALKEEEVAKNTRQLIREKQLQRASVDASNLAIKANFAAAYKAAQTK